MAAKAMTAWSCSPPAEPGGSRGGLALGGQGDDVIYSVYNGYDPVGLIANDTMDGGAGNDSLFGHFDNDSLIGGAGNDSSDGGRQQRHA
jgi:Ca2+-binding RTX toxin-like protein